MAILKTFIDVTYRDDANTTRTIRYRMQEAFNTDGSNAEAVYLAALDIEAALAALTGDHIDYFDITFRGGGTQHAADDASSNQLTAFTRVTLANNDAGEIQVPAWRFSTYEQNDQLMLDDAYNTAVEAVSEMLLDIESGQLMTDIEWTQSRTRKLRGKRIG